MSEKLTRSDVQKIEEEIEGFENFDEIVAALEKKRAETLAEAGRRAELLTAARKEAAQKLSAAIVEQLAALGMPDAKLDVSLLPAELSARGADEIEMMFSANAGEPEKPLSKDSRMFPIQKSSCSIP